MTYEFKKGLEVRTKDFSVGVIRFLKSFDYVPVDSVISKQVLRSTTSIGANYREANRAESRKDFIHKIGIVEKEAAETAYWFELMSETWEMTRNQNIQFINLEQESRELLALFSSISKKSKLSST